MRNQHSKLRCSLVSAAAAVALQLTKKHEQTHPDAMALIHPSTNMRRKVRLRMDVHPKHTADSTNPMGTDQASG